MSITKSNNVKIERRSGFCKNLRLFVLLSYYNHNRENILTVELLDRELKKKAKTTTDV